MLDACSGPFCRLRYVLAWVIALALGAGEWYHARFAYEDRRPEGDPARRLDGNVGHTSIDFGGQWLMGRMLMRGYGNELYHRARQWQVLEQAYPRQREAPAAREHDAEQLLSWFIGEDDPAWADAVSGIVATVGGSGSLGAAALAAAGSPQWAPEHVERLQRPRQPPGIGGPLYPPLHAFVMAPFARGDDPQRSYFAMQWVQLGVAYLAGLGVSRMSRGAIWWPIASALILVYPGFRGTVDLGQNSATTLCLLVWGWALMTRGRPVAGGILWGCLAYKPVWALSFFFALPLLGRWRAAGAMAVTGVVLVALTVPFVGLHSWFDWLYVGRQAAAKYNIDLNWVNLSRDLFGIPRRFFIDFTLDPEQRENPLARALSWALWLAVIDLAVRVLAARRPGPVPDFGPLPAFILFTAWLCTYRFMYYDALVSALPVFVLLVGLLPAASVDLRTGSKVNVAAWAGRCRAVWAANRFVWVVLAVLIFLENVLVPMKIEVTGEVGYYASVAPEHERAEAPRPKLVVGTGEHYPWDTVCILALWAWCGWRVLRLNRPAVSTRPGVAGPAG